MIDPFALAVAHDAVQSVRDERSGTTRRRRPSHLAALGRSIRSRLAR